MTRTLTAVLACTALFSASTANAQTYLGYVPADRAEIGEVWPDQTAADILLCTQQGLKASDLHLNRAQLRKWYATCAVANKAHAAMVAGNCIQRPHTAQCVNAVAQDTAIRRDDYFWGLIDALQVYRTIG